MKKTKETNNKGITLIALVITIIVMLILVGVTITMAVNGGLFEKAGEAAAKTNASVEAEQALANGAVTVGGKYFNSIGEYIKSTEKKQTFVFKVEYGGGMGQTSGILELEAEEGMTWEQWVNSAYNIVGAIIDEDEACEEYIPIEMDLDGNGGWLNYKTFYSDRGANIDFKDIIVKSEEVEYYLAGLE